MASVTLKNAAGKDTGSVELDAEVFGVEPNVPVMHQVVTAQLAARRSGSQSTKTRSDVRGGGAKPYRQKGTGRARQGSIRAPQFTGGGVALGPKPRSYAQKTPKKMVRLALRSALSDRATEGRVVVVDSWGFDVPKTKDAKAAIEALDLTGSVLVVLERSDENAFLSFRNLPNVHAIEAAELSAYDVLCNDWIVFTEATVPNSNTRSADSAEEAASTSVAAEGSASDEAGDSAGVAETSEPAAEGSASEEAGDSAEEAESTRGDES